MLRDGPLGDALLIAGKDLRVEWRSRTGIGQMAPFALLVLLLFAFALDDQRGVLRRATPGLFWIVVLLTGLLAVQRTFAAEASDGARDSLRLSLLDPAGVFLGKVAGVAAQLVVVEVLLFAGVAVLYSTDLTGGLLLAVTCLVGTLGVAAAGTLYGGIVAGVRGRETVLPLLLLPVLAPVLIGATQAFEAALGTSSTNGWAWLGLLGVFALVYMAFGVVAFGSVLEES